MIAQWIRVEERGLPGFEIGLREFVARFERPVEDGPRQQVAHFDAYERVRPPRAVGFETSTSMQWLGPLLELEEQVFRLMSIAGIRLAIASSLLTGGLRPARTPQRRRSRGPQCPAPLRRGHLRRATSI